MSRRAWNVQQLCHPNIGHADQEHRAGTWSLGRAGTIGVISPSGNELGPFLLIEQAALAHVVSDRSRTNIFAWYTLAGSLATATGALVAGASIFPRRVRLAHDAEGFFGIKKSHQVVVKLSGLFALDSLAGGFVVQSFAAYWSYLRFGVHPATLGAIFFGQMFLRPFPRF